MADPMRSSNRIPHRFPVGPAGPIRFLKLWFCMGVRTGTWSDSLSNRLNRLVRSGFGNTRVQLAHLIELMV
ncbi:hypothetical protein MTR_8g442540 [Medicago truncatula]|uniref:Uncharacterized protein n=1 Tax=Medicago truncatula TaxID=3880 RepID=A0A072TQN7_MEDTR|nr:hypothetical protein MTR_8g442540 [Medicago truncatula]